MSTFQLLLAFLIGLLANCMMQALSKLLFITRRIDKYFWLALTLLSGIGYIGAQLVLTSSLDSATLLLTHRIKLLFLLSTLVGWVFTFYRIYLPTRRYPHVFAILAAATACLVPFDAFLALPVKTLVFSFPFSDFVYNFGTTGPAYTALLLLVLVPFSIIPIFHFSRSRTLNRKQRIFGCLIFSPGLVGGLNDFAVTNGFFESIMISEYIFFTFLAGVTFHLFREDARNARRLANINQELEGMIHQRTGELEAANRKLRTMAATDMLTDLYNRRQFTLVLTREEDRTLRRTENAGTTFAVLFIDLDNFKYYNDSFGHAAGDIALVCFAKLLLQTLRTQDTAARYGGDEFVILLPETDEDGAGRLAGRILDALDAAAGFEREIGDFLGHPVAIPDGTRLGCSIGILAYDPARIRGVDRILIAADQALYNAKTAGKHRYCYWRPETDAAGRAGC